MNNLFNNRKFQVFLLFAAVFMATMFAFSPDVLADVGNSASHRSSSSSRSSSGGGDGDMIFFLFWLLVEHPFLFVIIVIGMVIYKVFLKNKISTNISDDFKEDVYRDEPSRVIDTPRQTTAQIVASLKESDPNFSVPRFTTKVNNIYIQLQEAWMNKDWKSVRPFETDELFNMHGKQLQQFIDRDQTNVVENICVLNSKIVGYDDDGVNDILVVELKARFNDYIINDTTKKVVEGNPNQDIYMTYEYVFIRKKGVKTEMKEDAKATACPNCGANISINESGECEYCGSTVSTGEYDWVLSAICVISQR